MLYDIVSTTLPYPWYVVRSGLAWLGSIILTILLLCWIPILFSGSAPVCDLVGYNITRFFCLGPYDDVTDDTTAMHETRLLLAF